MFEIILAFSVLLFKYLSHMCLGQQTELITRNLFIQNICESDFDHNHGHHLKIWHVYWYKMLSKQFTYNVQIYVLFLRTLTWVPPFFFFLFFFLFVLWMDMIMHGCRGNPNLSWNKRIDKISKSKQYILFTLCIW